eukprot:SAG22_NODE_228_length_14619_cov_4.604132_2_plen_282_part_00
MEPPRAATFPREHTVSRGGNPADNPEVALVIHQDPAGSWAGGNGATIWDAGLAMAAFLALVADKYVRGKTVVDVGSGTGFVGLVAAALGARAVALTDRLCALPLIKKNVAVNTPVLEGAVGPQQLAAVQLDWGDTAAAAELRGAETIIVSDCVWASCSALFPALVATIEALTMGTAGCVVLLAYERRTPAVEARFFELLTEKFEVLEVPAARQAADYVDADLQLFECTLRLAADPQCTRQTVDRGASGGGDGDGFLDDDFYDDDGDAFDGGGDDPTAAPEP